MSNHIIILQQHVSATSMTIFMVSYNQNMIEIQIVLKYVL